MPRKSLTFICLLLLTVTTQLILADVKQPGAASQRAQAPVVMLSLDGFRHDYLARGHSPNLERFAASGSVPKDLFLRFPPAPFLITTPSSPACTRGATELSAIPFTTGRVQPPTA